VAERRIALTINGRAYTGRAEPRKTLADFIREDCGLTGTHLGCEHGVCGACTILVDGEAVRSCLMFAVQADGAELMTVEGLADGDRLHPIQQAYWDHHGLQCGFCTPGFLMTTYALLRDAPDPTEREIREGLAGNLCRCTGYQNIVEAVAAAAQALRSGAALGPAWMAEHRSEARRRRPAAAPHSGGPMAGGPRDAGPAAGTPRARRRPEGRTGRTAKPAPKKKAPGRQRKTTG
jgi:carbon-monoxide dehydrogenase small subunit